MQQLNQLGFPAQSVLTAYFDLLRFSPKPAKWPALALTANAPQRYRYQRLVALFEAFDLPIDFASFADGEFLTGREAGSFDFLGLETTVASPHFGSLALPIRGHQAQYLFHKLFALLKQVNILQSFNSGVLEASGVYYHAHQLSQAVVQSLAPEPLARVTTTLARLLDPTERTFSQAELVAQHGFPDVDLDEIDFEWL